MRRCCRGAGLPWVPLLAVRVYGTDDLGHRCTHEVLYLPNNAACAAPTGVELGGPLPPGLSPRGERGEPLVMQGMRCA